MIVRKFARLMEPYMLIYLSELCDQSKCYDEGLLGEICAELKLLRTSKTPARGTFLSFLEACWKQLPNEINKRNPNKTAWPIGCSSPKFFQDFAAIILEKLYNIPPGQDAACIASFADLLTICVPGFDVQSFSGINNSDISDPLKALGTIYSDTSLLIIFCLSYNLIIY
jgi:hypothetical protein